MTTFADEHAALRVLAASPDRRIRPDAAAEYLALHPRTLEEWRRRWRQAESEGKPELRRGPKFLKISKRRILYEVRDLDDWKASATASPNWLSPEATAKRLGIHLRTAENWRGSWRQAEEAGEPTLRKGPPFIKIANHIWYDENEVNEFLAARNSNAATDAPDKSHTQAEDNLHHHLMDTGPTNNILPIKTNDPDGGAVTA